MSNSQPQDHTPRAGKPAGTGGAVAGFWQRISEGLELADLWTQFKSEARSSYGLYAQDVDWKDLEHKKGFARGWGIFKAFFWALVTKLTPVRRVILLMALVCLLAGDIKFKEGNLQIEFTLVPYGAALLLLLLTMELADRVTMKRDLEIAREIQRWLVPETPPPMAGSEVAFATRPANTVAGDYYDVIQRAAPHGGEQSLMVVADVAGKSVPAALLMATFQASLQALTAAPASLLDVVAGLNRYACAHSLGGMRFTTAFFAQVETDQRSMEYVCCGHNPALLRRASGGIERLDKGGLPLGIEANAQYESARLPLAPGDVLVIYTDGVVEAVNEFGAEFSDSRLLAAVAESGPMSADAMLRDLMQRVDNFVAGARQHDDITCLVLRMT